MATILIASALVLALVFFYVVRTFREKHLGIWLGAYLRQHWSRRDLRRSDETVHVLFCQVDHFEPLAGPTKDSERERMRAWTEGYPRLAGAHRDSEGRQPQHTWFYPGEAYDAECLDGLSRLAKGGYGEIELHLHHGFDIPERLEAKLTAAVNSFSRHGALVTAEEPPRFTYGFIHGNLGLNNARGPEYCGVNNELVVLRKTGCYADFSMPNAPCNSQTRKINSIYYASDVPGQRKSHDDGIDVEVGKPPDGDLMIVQGPLALDWSNRKFGLFPRIENAELSSAPSRSRVKLWVSQHIHVKGRPEWMIVKVSCHGAEDDKRDLVLGRGADRMFSYLEEEYRDKPGYALHYVTARELYNIIKAAEAGEKGNPAKYRDYLIPPTKPIPKRPCLGPMTSATYDWGVRTANEGENDYPIAFWCLVFFTFIVYVAPQNAVPALQALYPGKFTMAVAILAYVGQRLSKGASILPAGKEFRLLGLFFFLGVCSVPLSMWPGGSFEVASDLFVKSMVVCVLTAQLLTSVKRFRQMLWCVLLFGLATAIIGLLEYQKGHVVEGYRLNGTWAGISGNPNDFSLTLNLIIPFAVALYMLTTRVVHKVVIIAFLVFAVIGILLTFSRSGFLTLATIVALAMLKFTAGGSRQKFVVPILLLGIAFIAFAPEGYGTRIESIFDSSKDQVGSSQVRVDAMRYSLQSMAEHPLFGVGLGMNILGIKDLGMGWQHVHNVYLQIGTEMGVPAMIIFVMFLLNVFGAVRTVEKQAKRVDEVTDIQVLAIASQISMAAFIVAAFFYPVGYHFYMYYVAGFCLALKQIAATSVETVPVKELQNPYARWA